MSSILIQNLHPAHLEDLQKSGLSNETILEAGIKSVPPRDISKKLGFDIPGLSSMYEIPYDGEYSRYKVFYEENSKFNKDGTKKPKYLCRKDSGNRLYIPQKIRSILPDVAKPLYITEGEKKALKAIQEGLPCVAVSGLWNWSNGNKELIQDFAQIALVGRTVYLIPDSDWLEPNREGKPKNLEQAVYALAYLLIDRGAKVNWVELPQGRHKNA